MDSSFKNLIQKLISLDQKAEKLDLLSKEIRILINDIFWDIKDSRKHKKTA